MAYTGNPSTDTSDAVRLLISDMATSTAGEVFTDNEIEWFNANHSNTYLAAAAAVRSLIGSDRATTLAGLMSKQVGDLKLDFRTVSITDLMLSKAKQLRMQGVRSVKPYAGGISESDKKTAEQDTDWEKPFSRIGIHDIDRNATAFDSTR